MSQILKSVVRKVKSSVGAILGSLSSKASPDVNADSDPDVDQVAAQFAASSSEEEQTAMPAIAAGDETSEAEAGDCAEAFYPKDTSVYRSSNWKNRPRVWTNTDSYWPYANLDPSKYPLGNPASNLWAKGGALDKFDKAFGTKARAFELQPYYNFLVGLPCGYYIPRSKIDPRNILKTTGVDARSLVTLNGFRVSSGDVSWFGSCDKVAGAAILFEEPNRPVTMGGQTFSVEDIKGILTLMADAYIKKRGWAGDRNERDTPNVNDNEMDPENFVNTVIAQLNSGRCVVCDTDSGSEVWNSAFNYIEVRRGKPTWSRYENKVYCVDFEVVLQRNKSVVTKFYYRTTNRAGKWDKPKWLSGRNPDFLWWIKEQRDLFSTKSDRNPKLDPAKVKLLYEASI